MCGAECSGHLCGLNGTGGGAAHIILGVFGEGVGIHVEDLGVRLLLGGAP